MSSTLVKGQAGGALKVGYRLFIADGVEGDADVVANADDLAELSGEGWGACGTSIVEAAKGISQTGAIRLRPERDSRLPTARYPNRHPVTVLGMAGFEWFSWAEGDRGTAGQALLSICAVRIQRRCVRPVVGYRPMAFWLHVGRPIAQSGCAGGQSYGPTQG